MQGASLRPGEHGVSDDVAPRAQILPGKIPEVLGLRDLTMTTTMMQLHPLPRKPAPLNGGSSEGSAPRRCRTIGRISTRIRRVLQPSLLEVMGMTKTPMPCTKNGSRQSTRTRLMLPEMTTKSIAKRVMNETRLASEFYRPILDPSLVFKGWAHKVNYISTEASRGL